ncbi:unnamed protein product [Symbiodinium natans]|uniref:Uncharacterized protein n=1 Tax=Symbiodinium natans TaxID=878477 RepID=A0A812PD29_9DINO|nr:unnamed protein product [Symbiodinium natans]
MGSSPQAEKDGLRLSEIIESIGSQSSRTRVQPCSTQEKPTLKEDDDEIDPDIRELGDYFNIEERWVVRLNEAMKKRQDTKTVDIEKLYEVLEFMAALTSAAFLVQPCAALNSQMKRDGCAASEEKARSPTGLLTVQIGKMECGQFVGKIKPDKDVERMASNLGSAPFTSPDLWVPGKFKLDDPVTSRLTELKVWRKRNGQEDRATKDLERIEYHLRFAKRPNALCTLLVGKLLEGEMDELPDLTKAEKIMTDYKLDEDACSKMREIIEKRYEDEERVLTSVRKHLNSASNASSMLCKIARQLIDGGDLPDPPERPPKGKGGGKDGGKDDGERGERGLTAIGTHRSLLLLEKAADPLPLHRLLVVLVLVEVAVQAAVRVVAGAHAVRVAAAVALAAVHVAAADAGPAVLAAPADAAAHAPLDQDLARAAEHALVALAAQTLVPALAGALARLDVLAAARVRNNPMMAMMMSLLWMMNMQQMMAKAGGAPPEQGMSAMNPMAAMMGALVVSSMRALSIPAGMANMGGGGAGPPAPEKEKPTIKDDDDETIDPDLRELGDYFNIEERWVVRLNEAMKKRQDTKAQDIEKLYEVLESEKARSPTGLLTVQIGKMECGQFVGKIKPDKDVERMARKFKLDDHVTSRVTELKVWRKRNGEEDRAMKDLERIEYHLRFAKRPNALCTLLVGRLLEGEIDELPDLTNAEKIMTDFKLDEDACSKMREIIEKRHLLSTNISMGVCSFAVVFALEFLSVLREMGDNHQSCSADEERVLTSVRKHLKSASNASSMLCKIARQLIDGGDLPDPPERPPKGKGGGKDGGKDDGERGERRDRDGGDRHHDRDRDRHKRDRSRSRDRRERRDSRGR